MTKFPPPDVAGARRVLLLAPTGRDAEITSNLLGRSGFECTICDTAADLANAIADGAGLVVMTAEALSRDGMRLIAEALALKAPKVDTKTVSYELFKAGKTMFGLRITPSSSTR